MCFKKPRTPEVVRTDPVAQQKAAEDKAALRVNQESLDRTLRRRRTAALTQANATGTSGTALGAPGRQTLGGL
jgi:hypothetical protein